jgi:hypothetical protein
VSLVGASPLLGRSSNLNVEASPGYPGLTLPTGAVVDSVRFPVDGRRPMMMIVLVGCCAAVSFRVIAVSVAVGGHDQ